MSGPRLYPGWPWKPAKDVRNPEIAYWLSRAEQTWCRNPRLSTDLMRAVRVEIDALYRCTDSFERHLSQLVSVIVTLVVAGWFGRSAPLLFGGPHAAAIQVVVIVTLFAWVWNVTIRRRIVDMYAHRTVLARDRLNRWLAVAPPPKQSTPETSYASEIGGERT